jgi:hypothetical protein
MLPTFPRVWHKWFSFLFNFFSTFDFEYLTETVSCRARTDGVKLPTGYYFGMSATTGDLSGELVLRIVFSSVGDSDPQDSPHVFGPPGSGSISQRYGSGSRSLPFNIKMLSGLKDFLQN